MSPLSCVLWHHIFWVPPAITQSAYYEGVCWSATWPQISCKTRRCKIEGLKRIFPEDLPVDGNCQNSDRDGVEKVHLELISVFYFCCRWVMRKILPRHVYVSFTPRLGLWVYMRVINISLSFKWLGFESHKGGCRLAALKFMGRVPDVVNVDLCCDVAALHPTLPVLCELFLFFLLSVLRLCVLH